MKVILEPIVTVVGHSTFVEHPVYKIPSDGTDAEKLGAFAAKGCYDSYSPTGRANVENQRAVLESEHGSVLEHAHLSLFIEGITRAASLELNRHRPFNISQRSTRYTKEEDSAIVLEPYFSELYKKYNTKLLEFWYDDSNDVTKNTSTRGIHVGHNGGPIVSCITEPDARFFIPEKRFKESLEKQERLEYSLLVEHLYSCNTSIYSYGSQVESLIDLNPNKLTGFDLRKWARGKARNVLPHALETRGTWTNNYRGLRWFIELRSERHAEPEIRLLANKIYEAAYSFAPTYFEDFTSELVDGIPEWKPKYHKV